MDLRHLVEITEGRSPADLETIVNQAASAAVQAGEMIGADTLMQAPSGCWWATSTATHEGTRTATADHRDPRVGPLPGRP
jgi:hypothetical protein